MNGKADSTTVAPTTRLDVIDTQGGRILCVADTRGRISTLNELAEQYNAKAVIHTGDFGFYEPASLPRIADRTLKHLIQYSNLITPAFRSALLAPNVQPAQLRQMLTNPPAQFLPASNHNAQPNGVQSNASTFALSEFPQLLTGQLRLNVPVYTVWGSCEDVGVLEKLRASPSSPIHVPGSSSSEQPAQSHNNGSVSNWCIPNLTVLSESNTRTLSIGNVKLRLFGLGGASVPHKMFDNGDGQATIAGGGGTMWTTMLQIGELIDTAARVYDPSETRLLVTHASPGRDGLIAQVALALKADLTVSASLHFRYGVSYNEFSVQHDLENYRNKFVVAKGSFNEVWDTVKTQVEAVIDDGQRKFLQNALAVTSRVPAEAPQPGAQAVEEPAWKNTWNWNLPDANFGSLVLDVKDGRISSELRSQGFNFSYRANAGKQQQQPPTAPANFSNAPTGPAQQRNAGNHNKHQSNNFNNNGPRNAPSQPQQQGQSQQHSAAVPAQTQQPPHSQHQQNQRGPQQQHQQGPKHAHKKDHSKGTPSEAADSKPNDAEPSSSAPSNAAGQSPSIERPNSSASSRRASQYGNKRGGGSFNKGPRDDSEAPAASIDNQQNNNNNNKGEGFDGGRGRGRGGRGNNRGGRGSGSFRGGRGGHRNESDGAPSPAATPAPVAAPAATSNGPSE